MQRTTWMQFFEAMPEVVQAYLLDEEAIKAEDKARDDLTFDHDAWERVMDVVWDAIYRGVSEQEVRTRLAALAVDRDPREVERAVLFYVLLPLADLLPWDIERRLQELGCQLVEIQAVGRITLRPVSYGAAVRRIAAQAGLSLLTEEVIRRCRDVLISYVKGVRLMEQVKESLQRKQQEGGVGLTRAQTEAFSQAMVDFLQKTQVISEQEYADWLGAYHRQAQSDQISWRNQVSVQSDVNMPDGESLVAVRVPAVVHNSERVLDEAVAKILSRLQWQGDEFLMRRLRSLLSTRLRDVRNAQAVRDLLQRGVPIGGMGLTPEEAERLSLIIEQGYQAHSAQLMEAQQKYFYEVQEKHQQKIGERKERESQAHAAWYEKKIKARQKEEAARQVFFNQMKEVATRGPTVMPQPAQPIVDGVVSVAPTQLYDLTEELRRLSLEVFRRLSKDPQVAAQKVIQKLTALVSESFERGTQGVEAWRSSPLQQEYLKLVADSFQKAKPVTQVAEEKRSTDPNALSSQEVGAILEINAKAQL